jgi:hypothetical protein
MTTINNSIIMDSLHRLSQEMVYKLKKLSQNEWESPSRCHMWATKDVVSHMIATSGFLLNSVNRALQGDGLPPEGAPNPGVGSATTMSPGIASRAIQISETELKKNDSMIEILQRLESDILKTLRSLSIGQWNLVSYHPVNTLSIRDIMLIKLMESTLHSWDFQNALDETYQIDVQSAELLLEVWKNPLVNRWFISPDEEDFGSVTLDFHLSNQSRIRILTGHGEVQLIEPKESSMVQADAEVYVDSGFFSLLITARANLENALKTGQARLTGDSESAKGFHRWFRGT